ncbi:MAG TPA: sugar ABC transporter substrate-binding protein [Actinomycetota bacterium]|nr:sugar ABC transporter substrate-binding protein [Actinomycetota bacterium]
MRRPSWRSWRVLATVAVLAIVSTACLGGGNNGSNAPGQSITPKTAVEPTSPVTITFSSWVGDSPQMQGFVKDFEKLHPNINIQLQSVSSANATNKLIVQVAGNTAPDVAFVDSSAVTEFGSRNALVNLDGYMAGSPTSQPSEFVPAFLQMNQYGGSTYGLPYDGETTAMFYRKDLFDAAGLSYPTKDWTWDQFQSDAAKLTNTAQKQYGFAIFAPESEYYWEPFLWQAGGHLTSADGNSVAFNSPQGIQSANFYVGLKQYSPPDYYGQTSWDGRVAFATGKVAMYEAGSWFGGEMNSSFPQIKGKWDVAPLPAGPGGCATTVAGDSLVMFSQSKNQDAAWLWMQYLTQPDNMKAWTYGSPTTTLLPPRVDLLNDTAALGKYNPWLEGFAQQMDCAVADNLGNKNWGQVSDELNKQLGKAIYGDITPEEAINTAAQNGQQMLSGG